MKKATSAKTAQVKKPKAKRQQPIAIDKAEQVEITFHIGTKFYALEPKPGEHRAAVNTQSVLLLAMDTHNVIDITDTKEHELKKKLNEVME